jgi:hypothetical protein
MAALSEPRMVFSQWKKFLADFSLFVLFNDAEDDDE